MSRLSNALLAALVLHGLLFLVRTRHAVPHERAAPAEPAPELVEVDEAVVEPAAPSNASSDDALPAGPTVSAPSAAALRVAGHAERAAASNP